MVGVLAARPQAKTPTCFFQALDFLLDEILQHLSLVDDPAANGS